MRWLKLGALLAACTAAGCQSQGGLRLSDEETAVQPEQAVEAGGMPGRQVAWGGLLVSTDNLRDRTRLEILSFPLDEAGRPGVDETPGGRFVADYFAFLDPLDYKPGRQLTVRGTLGGMRRGEVGETPYLYPVVEAVEVTLWPESSVDGGGFWPPQLHIGIGVYGGF